MYLRDLRGFSTTSFAHHNAVNVRLDLLDQSIFGRIDGKLLAL